MNSLVKVFSNFKEFYSEINGATLTGAIDVIVVEQPDGSYLCSPFHVRFGKLGVLRSREKVVDIEVNGEPVDIHMKLGESGEAFFVEECSEGDLEELPQHMATSPIPQHEYTSFEDTITVLDTDIKIPVPRRNSIDLTKDIADAENPKFDNQSSDYSHRRHTDNTLQRHDLSSAKKEFTTQKLRQEWAAEQDQFYEEIKEKVMKNFEDDSKQFRPITEDGQNDSENNDGSLKDIDRKDSIKIICAESAVKDDSKSKKKRRKKSMIKKKNSQRKNSTSSSAGSLPSEQIERDATESSITISSATNNTESTSNDASPNAENENASLTTEEIEESSSKADTAKILRDLEIHFFSDTEVSMRTSRPSTPVQSDTEFEVRREKSEDVMTSSASWKWGELPTQTDESNAINSESAKQAQRNSMLSGMFSFMKQTNKMRKNIPDGLYLSDLDSTDLDPEIAALYFPKSVKGIEAITHAGRDEDRESGNGTSIPQSPNSMECKQLDMEFDDKISQDNFLNLVALSLCGGMDKKEGPSDEEFESHLIQYSEVCHNPAVFADPNLVVRLNNKYYSWITACPLVMTLLAFQKPLPNAACEKLLSSTKDEGDAVQLPVDPATKKPVNPQESRRSWWYWRRSAGMPESKQPQTLSKSLSLNSSGNIESSNSYVSKVTSTPIENIKESDAYNGSMSSEDSFGGHSKTREMTEAEKQSLHLNVNDKYRKTLRLSSKQIECLNLNSGMNEIEFSVTTAYQGTSRCKCFLFQWKHNDKVVISDIDGTITKSDVLGHILPMVGKDWAQMGVAQLFSKIEENGYKMLYLSARAIGQSRATREYLKSIRQGDVKLPDGPLLLNPTSLMSALHREVIERKPEQFKIECLSDIKALFSDKNPFYAGYGNRINDVWAYRAVGIPIMRIYTINPRGELKHELTQTFQSTYCSMAYIVDQLFPPIIRTSDSDDDMEYTSFNYWREPLDTIEIDVESAGPEKITVPVVPVVPLPSVQSKTLPTILEQAN